jgi:hypothetical protein
MFLQCHSTLVFGSLSLAMLSRSRSLIAQYLAYPAELDIVQRNPAFDILVRSRRLYTIIMLGFDVVADHSNDIPMQPPTVNRALLRVSILRYSFPSCIAHGAMIQTAFLKAIINASNCVTSSTPGVVRGSDPRSRIVLPSRPLRSSSLRSTHLRHDDPVR